MRPNTIATHTEGKPRREQQLHDDRRRTQGEECFRADSAGAGGGRSLKGPALAVEYRLGELG